MIGILMEWRDEINERSLFTLDRDFGAVGEFSGSDLFRKPDEGLVGVCGDGGDFVEFWDVAVGVGAISGEGPAVGDGGGAAVGGETGVGAGGDVRLDCAV